MDDTKADIKGEYLKMKREDDVSDHGSGAGTTAGVQYRPKGA